MSNVVSIYPKKSDLILLYEVVGESGHPVWGGEGAGAAVDWYRRSPVGSRLFVSAWDSDEEDAHLVGRPMDITAIINQAIREGKGE